MHALKIKKLGQNLTELDFFGSPASAWGGRTRWLIRSAKVLWRTFGGLCQLRVLWYNIIMNPFSTLSALKKTFPPHSITSRIVLFWIDQLPGSFLLVSIPRLTNFIIMPLESFFKICGLSNVKFISTFAFQYVYPEHLNILQQKGPICYEIGPQ